MNRVPEGWATRAVGDLCNFINGNGFKSSEWSSRGLPIIRIQNLNGSTTFNYYEGKVQDKWLVNPGDILFAWAGTRGVSFGAKIWNGPTGLLNQHIFKVSPKGEVDLGWLYLALVQVTRKIELKAHGFKATLLHVQKTDITDQLLRVPTLVEQQKIAQILSTWDQAITTTEQLLANSQQQKKALMQQLLGGQSGQSSWREYRFSDLFRRVTKKNKGKSKNVVTISAQKGLIRQEDFFSKSIASINLDDYFLLEKGQFAYNKSYSKGYPMGAIKRLNYYDYGVVTTLYICFEIIVVDESNSDYFEHFFQSGMLNIGLRQIAHEGGRAHGLLNVKPSDFFNLKIKVPLLEEQQKIARILNTADEELNLLEARLARLNTEKKALMQQLLTGKRRVIS